MKHQNADFITPNAGGKHVSLRNNSKASVILFNTWKTNEVKVCRSVVHAWCHVGNRWQLAIQATTRPSFAWVSSKQYAMAKSSTVTALALINTVTYQWIS